ncbi:MAG: hypothetical protein OEZ08_00960 [Betaproteobacteria bacterium]|nr:hypothetical protein [Betaproteobacteria bacterium]
MGGRFRIRRALDYTKPHDARVRCEQAGQVLVPRRFAFVLEILRVDGESIPVAVENAERAAQLLDDVAPEHVAVECADCEDLDAVRAALGVGADRAPADRASFALTTVARPPH